MFNIILSINTKKYITISIIYNMISVLVIGIKSKSSEIHQINPKGITKIQYNNKQKENM